MLCFYDSAHGMLGHRSYTVVASFADFIRSVEDAMFVCRLFSGSVNRLLRWVAGYRIPINGCRANRFYAECSLLAACTFVLVAGCNPALPTTTGPPEKDSSQQHPESETFAMDRPSLESLFASPNDFELTNELFRRIAELTDGNDLNALRNLPEPQRVVLQVCGASGIIGNGGFRYLFEGDLADFQGIAESYELINATRASAAIRGALALFPNSQPPANVDQRLTYLEKLGGPALEKLNQCSEAFWDSGRETKRLLGIYIRAHKSEFASLGLTSGESTGESKELPFPGRDAKEDAVVLWLKSIGASVSRRSDLPAAYFTNLGITQPSSGDPVVTVNLNAHRTCTNEEIRQLSECDALKSLRVLGLRESFVTTEGLGRLSAISALEKLELEHTDVKDDWLPLLAENRELKILDLSSTQISDNGLASLAEIRSLRDLTLARTKVQGHALAELSRLPMLQVLSLFEAPVSDEGLARLSELSHLTYLQLGHTAVTDRTMEQIGRLTELRALGLSSTGVTDLGLRQLEHLQKLENLYLESDRIDGSGFAALSALQHLKRLELYETNVTDAGVKHISLLSDLIELNLSSTRISNVAIPYLVKLTKLKSLSISETRLKDGPEIRQFAQLKSLKFLSFPEGFPENSRHISYLRKQLPDAKIE